MALNRTSDVDQARTHDCIFAELARELDIKLLLDLYRFTEESIEHASISLTCQEFCNAFEPSKGIYIPQKLCGQMMRFEEKIKWNQEMKRGGKGNEWWQGVEGK